MIRQVEANGAGLSVVDVGKGQPLVFLHGWCMSGRFFSRQIEGLAADHRIVVPDLRGHGESEKVPSGHTLSTYASDLYAVIQALGLKRPVLIGWSMGALVAYEYVRAFGSEGIAGLVVVDQPPSDYEWEDYDLGISPFELQKVIEEIQVDQRGFVESFLPLMLHQPDRTMRDWMVDEMIRVSPSIACASLVDQTLRDYRPFLAGLNLPMLVLFGEDDKLMSPLGGELTASLVDGSRLHLFGRSSHCPFWEEPVEFNDLMVEFALRVG